ncbi:MAG: hypothetical protein ABW061_25515 [Polyangiaceae bacterium]
MPYGSKLLGLCVLGLGLIVACQPDLDSLDEKYSPTMGNAGAGGKPSNTAGSGNTVNNGGDDSGGAGPTPAACKNGMRDSNETDVDCGGTSKCGACDNNLLCKANKDCQSEFCKGTRCAEPTCADGVKNQDETAIDCGGSCSPELACDVGIACKVNADCSSEFCKDDICTDHCVSGTREADETDKDCGGSCDPCADALHCVVSSDCESKVCFNNKCQPATCDDKVQNQDESDKDCGGVCSTTGKACTVTAKCNEAADCDSYICTKSKCVGDITVPANQVIDDFEDGEFNLPTTPALEGRVGQWYPYGDPAGIPTMAIAPIKRAASTECIHGAGKDFQTWGAGLGVDLNQTGSSTATKKPYDASDYTGVTFWARVDVATSLTLVLPDGNTDKAGGKCTTCDHHWYKTLQVGTTWQRYTVTFDSLILEPNTVPPPPDHLDSAALVSVQFRVPSNNGAQYDMYIDDVAFVTE